MINLRKIAASIAAKKARIAEIATGHGGKMAEEWLFDTVIYGAITYFCQQQWGMMYGSFATFCIMAPVSIGMCLLYLKFYDWLGRDIFGFEALKETEDDVHNGGWIYRYVVPLIKKGDAFAFVILSIFKDPFMVVVYLRDRSLQYQGMGRREWKIFWGSIVFSNAYWTIRWNVLVALAIGLWNQVF